jgi:AcrR family transcriptional regulator
MTDETDPTAVPPSVAAAWGVSERPGRGPRRGLSVAAIVRAAVGVAQEEGLAAVSMNRVAAALDTAAMSLYRYVSSKDELLALMVDEAQGPPPAIPRPGDDWRTGLNRWAGAQTDVYRAHPWLLLLPISGPPIMPNVVAWFERGLRCLAGTGLAEDEKVGVILLISGLVRSQATLEAQLEAAMRSPESAAVIANYGRLLRGLTDRERCPAIHAAIDAGAFNEDDDDDLGFAFGLERVLDGIAAYMRQRDGGDG